MKIKIMYPNQYGNLEFKREELEKLLEEAYQEGYLDGQRSNSYYPFYYSSPSVTLTGSCDGTIDTATALNSSCTKVTALESVKIGGELLSNEI